MADLDRLVRADGDAKVRLTIEPEQKKLQIGPITSAVRLVSVSCRTKGQKIKVADFKSPDERATAIKRMCAADTPVLLSIEEIDGQLFGGRETAKGENHAKNQSKVRDDGGDKKENIDLKFQGLRGCKASISLLRRDDHWHAGYSICLGFQSLEEKAEDAAPVGHRSAALAAAKVRFDCWLDTLVIVGNKDAQRATTKRRDQMRAQIKAQMEEMIEAAVELEKKDAEDLGLDANEPEERDEDKDPE